MERCRTIREGTFMIQKILAADDLRRMLELSLLAVTLIGSGIGLFLVS